MKEDTGRGNEHARKDFFDWWDGLEALVAPVKAAHGAEAVQTPDAPCRTCSNPPCGRLR